MKNLYTQSHTPSTTVNFLYLLFCVVILTGLTACSDQGTGPTENKAVKTNDHVTVFEIDKNGNKTVIDPIIEVDDALTADKVDRKKHGSVKQTRNKIDPDDFVTVYKVDKDGNKTKVDANVQVGGKVITSDSYDQDE